MAIFQELNQQAEEQQTKELSIELLRKKVTIRCPVEQEERLLLAAELLEERLQSLQKQQQPWNRDAMLAITALNLMDELLGMKQEFSAQNQASSGVDFVMDNSVKEQINKIIKKIDAQGCKQK